LPKPKAINLHISTVSGMGFMGMNGANALWSNKHWPLLQATKGWEIFWKRWWSYSLTVSI